MIAALISFLGGSVFRMLWGEISVWLTKKQEHAQELERLRLQNDLDAAQHARQQEAVRLQAELGIKMVQVQAEAARYGDSPESANVRRLYYYLVAAIGLVLLWIAGVHALALAAPFTFTWSGLAICVVLSWVTGSLGDAAAALQQYKHGPMQSMKLRHRLDRPTPRVAAGLALRGLASAVIDISDGVAQDLGHILSGSGVGAELELGRLPVSASLLDFHKDDTARWALQLSGGDDYELCFTASPAEAFAIEQAMAAVGVTASVIGHITAESGLHCLTPDGEHLALEQTGYRHFAETKHVH